MTHTKWLTKKRFEFVPEAVRGKLLLLFLERFKVWFNSNFQYKLCDANALCKLCTQCAPEFSLVKVPSVSQWMNLFQVHVVWQITRIFKQFVLNSNVSLKSFQSFTETLNVKVSLWETHSHCERPGIRVVRLADLMIAQRYDSGFICLCDFVGDPDSGWLHFGRY